MRKIAWAIIISLAMFASHPAGAQQVEQRSYTINEIDELRLACEKKYLWGSYNGPMQAPSGWSRSYNESDKAKVVEEMVRTWMFAGKTAQDLYASEGMSR